MYVTKITLKNGVHYYSFSYTCQKTKKRVKLKKSEHPLFTDKNEAILWAKSQEAHRQIEKTRVELALKWRNEYFNFNQLLKEFSNWYQYEAPNSYQQTIIRLEHYVFRFFLQEKKCGNVAQWNLYHEEFKGWLRNCISLRTGKVISYSTKNHAIKALNNFTTFLRKHNKLTASDAVKCESFAKHLVKDRSYEDIVSSEEFIKLYDSLELLQGDVSDFYYILRFTGMRFNELFSLEKDSLYSGDCPLELQSELNKFDYKVFGYILLNSQSSGKTNNKAPRKPLKGRKKIDHKNSRMIPITDKKCWNLLAKRYQKSEQLFFEDTTYHCLLSNLKKAYYKINKEMKSYHCLRHSYATELIGKTKSYFLMRVILGHKTMEIMDKYIHIYEKLNLEGDKKRQVIELV